MRRFRKPVCPNAKPLILRRHFRKPKRSLVTDSSPCPQPTPELRAVIHAWPSLPDAVLCRHLGDARGASPAIPTTHPCCYHAPDGTRAEEVMPFKKGQNPGNPGGRPRSWPRSATWLGCTPPWRLKRYGRSPAIRLKTPCARVAACNSLLDRGYGKPAQAISVQPAPPCEELVLVHSADAVFGNHLTFSPTA